MKRLSTFVLLAGLIGAGSFGVAANFAPDWTWKKLQQGQEMWRVIATRAVLAGYSKPKNDNATRHAERNGSTVTVYPESASLRVPDGWLSWYEKFHNNFHLTRKQLLDVETGAGEWDTEYGRVVNAAFPFDECAAHVGGEGWGKEGTSFVDVQLRVYVTTMSPTQVIYRLEGPGLEVARGVFRNASGAQFVDRGTRGRWRNAEISYYGGTERIRTYATTAGEYTLVLVFMGGRDNEVQWILNSVEIPSQRQ